jgi:replicative DNA helicase Mcm
LGWFEKGTIGILMDEIDMPFNKFGLKPDLIVNPCAIPSRMTIGQLAECLVGKAAALQGMDADATPFEDRDFTSVEDMLEKLGYERKGKEYLYNGMTGEKMLVQYFFGPTYYQRLKHLVADKIHCLTENHEVLTENGWKFFKDIKKKEKVATLKDGKLVYEAPTKLLHFPNYKGKMYRIKTQQVNLDVTANHRMWVAKPKRKVKTYYHELAENLVGKHIQYKKNADWDMPDYQFVLPSVNNNGIIFENKVVDMDAWLTFFGIFMAEGCASQTKDARCDNVYSNTISIAVHKQRVKDVLYAAITKLGYKYTVSNNVLRFTDKQICTYMRTYSPGAENKTLPDWVWKLSKNQCINLLKSMILGDGTYHESTMIYFTSSTKLADDVSRLALHCGWSANKIVNRPAGHTTEIKGRKITSKYDAYRLGINTTKNTPAVNHGHTKEQNITQEEVYDFEGSVFCLEVPSEVFYVRKDGIPVWTGNSRARGLTTSLTRLVACLPQLHLNM